MLELLGKVRWSHRNVVDKFSSRTLRIGKGRCHGTTVSAIRAVVHEWLEGCWTLDGE